jgi:putative tryptophan/tyrosine transport system substrate-binding protein
LVRRQVAVIAATDVTALMAKAATTTIPVVFGVGEDPVRLGLVASLARPGGNATGVNFFLAELGSKQLGLLNELIPAAARIGLLVNPNAPASERATKEGSAAAAAIGLQIEIASASDSREIDSVFAALARNRADALLVGPDAFFLSRRLQLAILAARHAIPVVYNSREYAETGELMSYGTGLRDAHRQLGVYASKFELVINLSTARALSLDVPPSLLAHWPASFGKPSEKIVSTTAFGHDIQIFGHCLSRRSEEDSDSHGVRAK